MKNNIRLALYKLTPASLLLLLRHVIGKLTGNLFFPAPPHTLVAMNLLADNLEAAAKNALQGGVAERELRNALVLEVKDVLTQTANYVRTTANGDRVKLSTCGFDLARTPEPIGVPNIPFILGGQATGRAGQVEFRWTGEKGAHIYTVWVCKTDPKETANWTIQTVTTRTRILVDQLTAYEAVWFAVSATGAAGESAISDPILLRAA